MTTEGWLQLLLRALPALIVLVLAFVAASDKGTRQRWADLMYQAGAVRADQRDKPEVQRGVRLPFFLVALLLLLWPILYFRHATRTIEITQQSDLFQRTTPVQNNTNALTNSATPNVAPTAAPTAAPVDPNTPHL